MKVRITNPRLARAWACAYVHWPAAPLAVFTLIVADALTR